MGIYSYEKKRIVFWLSAGHRLVREASGQYYMFGLGGLVMGVGSESEIRQMETDGTFSSMSFR